MYPLNPQSVRRVCIKLNQSCVYCVIKRLLNYRAGSQPNNCNLHEQYDTNHRESLCSFQALHNAIINSVQEILNTASSYHFLTRMYLVRSTENKPNVSKVKFMIIFIIVVFIFFIIFIIFFIVCTVHII